MISTGTAVAPGAEATQVPRSGVVLIRAIAAVLVLHGFLVGLWTTQHDIRLGYLDAVRHVLNRPLGIGEDFGVFAVMLLLTTGGYLAQLDRAPLRWQLVRGYLPVGVSSVLATIVAALGAQIWTVPLAPMTDVLAAAGNVTLVSHLVNEVQLLVPLAWFVLLLLAGTAAAAVINEYRGLAMLVVPLGQIVLSAAVVAIAPDSRLAGVIVFFPLVAVGQLIALAQRAGLKTGFVVASGFLSVFVMVMLQTLKPEFARWWYPVPAVFTMLLVGLGVVFSGDLAARLTGLRVVRWLSDHAVWLALLQGVVGYAVLDVLGGFLPVGVALVVAVVATGAVASACHRLVRRVPA
ncbi:hypothetical protein SK571_08855 [Lentzea sp. BCCO 10_0798]|uniref:Acyltransferase family protein n=1 Tax=Lentzea kristufekii TaxID=3095430 RepID=A0ABU4TML5_9PSEU|nr:hypothetical protein [Lentzea sp. BCCO 10_0798]MDX8049485.1 hypothetical protein [Lentzea sp. BCCO 10_0798]